MKEGWELKKLSGICEIRPPKKLAKEKLDEDEMVSFVPMKYLPTDQIYFSSPETKSLKKAYSGYVYFENFDVILAKITPCFENGKLGIATELKNGIGFGSSEFVVYRTGEKITSEFLYFYLSQEYFRKLGEARMTGAVGHKRIPKKFYEDYKIPIPPLPEQKAIVAILDKAFAAIDNAKANIEKNIKNAKELFQSKLNEIFSQKGDGWEEKTFKELSTRIGDGLHGTPEYDDEGEYYFINGNNLSNGKIEFKANTKRVNYNEFLKHKRELKKNTVLVSINGTLGNVAFYNNEPVILGKSACYINFIESVNKHYIKYLIKSPLFFENMAKESTGATIKNFSLKSMRNYKLFLPPFEFQSNTVNKLEKIENDILAVINLYTDKLDAIENLKKSLLQKAFAGELS